MARYYYTYRTKKGKEKESKYFKKLETVKKVAQKRVNKGEINNVRMRKEEYGRTYNLAPVRKRKR
jgi:hypothetical protein